MFFYNKKRINKMLILQVVLLLFYIVSSYSLDSSYYKKNFQESKPQSHISVYTFSSSEYYLHPRNSNINLKSFYFFYNALISWLILSSILNLSQNQKKYINYHNNNLGLYKKLKNILNPKYHRSKYKDYLAMLLK